MWLGVGLNSKQRQRKDTGGLSCKLHLLPLLYHWISHTIVETQKSVHMDMEKYLEKNPAMIKIFLVITLKDMYVLYYRL